MVTIELTEHNIAEQVRRAGVTLVDFRADWCAPCRSFEPVFEAASQAHPDVTFGTVDTEVERVLVASAHITSIPTLMAFRDGILVHRQAGALRADELDDVIAMVRDLDMVDIRARHERMKESA